MFSYAFTESSAGCTPPRPVVEHMCTVRPVYVLINMCYML